MIYIELPLWLVIVIFIVITLFIVYLLIGDFLIRLIHKKYDLELKDKEKESKDEKEN